MIALRRVVSIRKPVQTVASEAGTSSELGVLVGQRQACQANTSARPVPTAPSSSDVMKPISGLTSCWMSASRMACAAGTRDDEALQSTIVADDQQRCRGRPIVRMHEQRQHTQQHPLQRRRR